MPISRALSGLLFAMLLLAHSTAFAVGDPPKILLVGKIWDAGKHNAFTDLVWHRDQWLCTFREGDAHVGGEGKLRILASKDGKTWTPHALLTEASIDLRDPKLTEMPDGRLMMLAGGSVYEGKKLRGLQPRVAFSSDGGKTWTPTQRILAEGDWLWRVTWHKDRAYGIAYRGGKIALYSTADGVKYDRVADLAVSGHPNESTVRFKSDGTMIALVRREKEDQRGWVGTSPAPYTEWKWTDVPHRLGGPNFVITDDDVTMWAAGRDWAKPTNVLARFALPNTYEPVLTFPSGGDCSYPGMVIRDGVLYTCYYSSHEGKTNIYFAEVKLPTGAGL